MPGDTASEPERAESTRRPGPTEEAPYRVRVAELPEQERPRERLAHLGPGALTTAELLAIVLRT